MRGGRYYNNYVAWGRWKAETDDFGCKTFRIFRSQIRLQSVCRGLGVEKPLVIRSVKTVGTSFLRVEQRLEENDEGRPFKNGRQQKLIVRPGVFWTSLYRAEHNYRNGSLWEFGTKPSRKIKLANQNRKRFSHVHLHCSHYYELCALKMANGSTPLGLWTPNDTWLWNGPISSPNTCIFWVNKNIFPTDKTNIIEVTYEIENIRVWIILKQ